MSIFAELLWKQFPHVDFPGVNHSSISKLTMSWRYNSLYHISVRLIYHIYLLPYDDNKWKTTVPTLADGFLRLQNASNTKTKIQNHDTGNAQKWETQFRNDVSNDRNTNKFRLLIGKRF